MMNVNRAALCCVLLHAIQNTGTRYSNNNGDDDDDDVRMMMPLFLLNERKI